MNAKVSAEMLAKPSTDWTHYAKGIAWGTIVLFVGVVIGYAGMIAGVLTEAISLPVATLLTTVLLYLAFTVAHEAGHGNISHEVTWLKPVERLMGWTVTVPFLIIPFGLFAKIHDYHHAFTNDPDRDPDHWVSGNNFRSANFRAFTLALNYIYLASTRFRDDPVIAQTHKSSLLYYAVTLTISLWLILSGYGTELLMIGIIPAFLTSYVLGMLFDWIPHIPTNQQGRYQNTRSYLFPGLKYLTLGQNYHHIHHLYPRVSWYNYARVFDVVRPELEAKNSPIERVFSGVLFSDKLFSDKLPGFGKSAYAQEPSSVDGIGKFTLKVERIHQETADSVAITFQNMNGKNIPFKAGQYVTVTKLLNGDPVTRCYSICESPRAGKLTIGVKRVEKGLLSTYLNDELCAGDELTVAGPFGEFIFDPYTVKSTAKPVKLLTLIAGGSGITPIISIAQTALGTCSKTCSETKVHLIYANRSIGDVMFLRQVNSLLEKYPDRFSVSNIFETAHAGWEDDTGYLNSEKLVNMFSTDDDILDSQYYICGPEVMKNIVVSTLQELGVESKQVQVEEFGQSTPKPEGPVHNVNVVLANGSTHEFSVAENQTVLQAATQEGIKIPHACGVGQCGCCMVQVTGGVSELISDETPGILPGELERGLTLACQCRPKSALSLKEGVDNG